MKKYNWIIYFFILLPSCIGIKNQNSVEIDLSKTRPAANPIMPKCKTS